MVAYTSFAVIGVGALGTHVVSELLKHKVSLKVLTRDDTKPAFPAFKESGATVVKVDYANEAELQSALTGVQVVVSVIGQFSLEAQIPIAKVAKAAGVQLFVPAEYGVYVTESFTHHKKVVQDALMTLDLPFTLFYTGFFAEVFYRVPDYDFAGGKMRVVGTGDVAMSVTSRLDIARFLAHTLATAEPSELAWAKIPIEGDRKSHKEIAAIVERKYGTPIAVELVDLEETRKGYNTDPFAFFAVLIADGRAVSGSEADVKAAIAKFFPDWNPKPLEEVIEIHAPQA